MISVKIINFCMSGFTCDNVNCKHDLKYHDQVLRQFFIKQNTKVAEISMDNYIEIYCEGCITEIYHLLKCKLDKNMWAFQ